MMSFDSSIDNDETGSPSKRVIQHALAMFINAVRLFEVIIQTEDCSGFCLIECPAWFTDGKS
jgi:hypothetical protein